LKSGNHACGGVTIDPRGLPSAGALYRVEKFTVDRRGDSRRGRSRRDHRLLEFPSPGSRTAATPPRCIIGADAVLTRGMGTTSKFAFSPSSCSTECSDCYALGNRLAARWRDLQRRRGRSDQLWAQGRRGTPGRASSYVRLRFENLIDCLIQSGRCGMSVLTPFDLNHWIKIQRGEMETRGRSSEPLDGHPTAVFASRDLVCARF
jgi:hypothetical protein